MSAISSTTTTGARVNSTDAFDSLTSDQFLKIMFTELTNQDPLAPNDTKDLLDQISTLRSIQADVSLTQRLEKMAHHNEIVSAGSLIGKLVTGLTASGQRTFGLVDSISISREGTTLNLSNGSRLAFDRVDEVIDPALVPTDDPTPAPQPDPEPDDSIDRPGEPDDEDDTSE